MRTQETHYGTVADVMHAHVTTIAPEASVAELAALLQREGVSAVPVVEADGVPIGVASASDLLWMCDALLDPTSRADTLRRTVRDVMTPDVFSVRPTGGLESLCRFFQRAGVHRAFVVEGGRLVGVVALTDLLAVLASGPGSPL